MKIVIIGSGTVGGAICAQLAGEHHDITVVDTDQASIAQLADAQDVYGVVGNGADISVLQKAGADKADLLIAVTPGDELNLLCCAAARKLGAKHSVARVRNPEYTELMRLLKSEMNLSRAINPELSAAKEIYRSLRFPAAAKVETFYHGRVELAEFTLPEDSAICGKSLIELRNDLSMRFLICAVERGDEVFVPSGHFVLQAGDVLCVTAPEEEITHFFKEVGAFQTPVRNILVAGGGRISYYLLELLRKTRIRATVIEEDPALCRELAEQCSCTVINSDAAEQEVLLEQGLAETDAYLALSSQDEENVITSMYAKNLGVEKVITLIRKRDHTEIYKTAGLQTIVSPKNSTAAYLLRYVRALANVRGSEIESLYKIMGGKVEAIEFLVKEELPGLTGIMLKDLQLCKDVLIACIVHKEQIIIPSGADVIENGDTVIVIAKGGQLKGIKDIVK